MNVKVKDALKKYFTKRRLRKFQSVAVFFVCLLILFALSYPNFETGKKAHVDSLASINNVNNKIVSQEELFLETWGLVRSNYWDARLNEQDWSYWKRRYSGKIETPEDVYVALNSMLASLNDPYSKFLSESEFKDQNSIIDSKVYGIGINIVSISGKIYISNVLKGAPADLQGLKQGDMILNIDGQDIRGESIFQVSQYIKGAPGAVIELTVLRGDKKITKKIKREEIKIKAAEYKILEGAGGKVGYIHLLSFISQDTPSEFLAVLEKLKDCEGLILDLRGNMGGLFQNAIFVSNLFLEKGVIVNVVGRSGHLNVYRAEKGNFTYEKPLVVLIDSDSASSSEIVAGALQDHERAKLVGTATFGKGLVQKVYPMPNRTGVNLTIARYSTPQGNEIDKRGITPDYEVYFTKDDIAKNNDRQLNFAVDLVRTLIAGAGVTRD